MDRVVAGAEAVDPEYTDAAIGENILQNLGICQEK
jgi:hypothetical protein